MLRCGNFGAGATKSAGAGGLEDELGKLEKLETELAPQINPLPVQTGGRPRADITMEQLQTTWEQARAAAADSPERTRALNDLIEQLHALISYVSDAAGLTLSTELETNSVTDVVAFALPTHVVRLLQMHDQLTGVDALGASRLQAGIAGNFASSLNDEDQKRIARSTQLAIDGDAGSSHSAERFQHEYPGAAAAFLASLTQFAADINSTDLAAASPETREAVFHQAYLSAANFWRESNEMLDALLADQIDFAKSEREYLDRHRGGPADHLAAVELALCPRLRPAGGAGHDQ